MINILEIEYAKGFGGQERRTFRLINSLDRERFRVTLVVSKSSKLYLKKDEINAKVVGVDSLQIYNIATILKLIEIIKREKIDIISTHSGKDAWLGVIAGRVTGTKVIRVRHSEGEPNRFSYNLSEKVVAISKSIKESLIKVGVKREKLITIPTGVDIDRFNRDRVEKLNLRDELNLEPDSIIIGSSGYLRAEKRHIDLIEALNLIDNPKVKLVIVGDGVQRKNLEDAIERYSMQNRVFLLGHREDIERVLPNFDIFALCSSKEGLGTAIIEALAMKIPSVGSKTGGIVDLVQDKKALFRVGDIQMLKEALLRYIEDAKLRKRVGESAREFVAQNFSTYKMVKETEALYLLIGKKYDKS